TGFEGEPRSRSAPAAAHRAKTKERRTEKDQAGRLRYRRSLKELSTDFPVWVARGVDVEIAHSAQDPRLKRYLGSCDSPAAIGCDKSRVVDQCLREIKDRGGIGPGGHTQRESLKRGKRGGDSSVGAQRLAAMNVCCR